MCRWSAFSALLVQCCVVQTSPMSTSPDTVVLRKSKCYEKFGVTAGAPGDMFPFGEKTSTGFIETAEEMFLKSQEQHQLRGRAHQWPNPVTTKCTTVYDAVSCAEVGAFKTMMSPPTFSIIDDKTEDEHTLYSNTKTWLHGAGKGFQPTPSSCAWCESPGSGHGICIKCNSFDINNIEMQGFTCAPHCAASLGGAPPKWEPQKTNPFFPVPPPQHLDRTSRDFGTPQWCKILVDKVHERCLLCHIS